MKSRTFAYLLFSCFLLLLLFNFPLMEVANKQQMIVGIPLLPFYLFVSWVFAIWVLYKLANHYFKSGREDE